MKYSVLSCQWLPHIQLLSKVCIWELWHLLIQLWGFGFCTSVQNSFKDPEQNRRRPVWESVPFTLRTWLRRSKSDQSPLGKQKALDGSFSLWRHTSSSVLPSACILKGFPHDITHCLLLNGCTSPFACLHTTSSCLLVCCTEAFCSHNKDGMLLSNFSQASRIPLKLFSLTWQVFQEL